MRSISFVVAASFVTLSSFACASTQASSSSPFDTSAPARLDSLSVERGACYGKCEIYQFILHRDATVTLRKQSSESRVPITMGQAESLLSAAVDAGVLTLPAKIRADSTLCPLDATDHATIILSAWVGKAVTRVEHYTGCYADHELRVVPRLQRLVALERRVDALARQ